MDESQRTRQHAQRWSDGETRVRRIGIGGAIFALVILLTVIEPFYIKSAEQQKQLDSQALRLDEINSELARIDSLQARLDDMSRLLATEPWSAEIQALKDAFSSGDVIDPVARSNAALSDIATQLQSDVIAPIRDATAALDEDNPLTGLPDRLDNAVTDWLSFYEGRDWWITRDSKDDTAKAIGDELQRVLDDAAAALPDVKTALETVEAGARKRLEDVRGGIEELKNSLDSVIDSALPGWARGIVRLDQMLILYPWLLAGIAIYLVGTALVAARHFHAMADGEGWSTEQRRDPLYSSPWTLTPRGVPGSIATFVTYTSVLGVLAACLYGSRHPPASASEGSFEAYVNAIAAQTSSYAWVPYALLLAASAIVAAVLFRSRRPGKTDRPDGEDPGRFS